MTRRPLVGEGATSERPLLLLPLLPPARCCARTIASMSRCRCGAILSNEALLAVSSPSVRKDASTASVAASSADRNKASLLLLPSSSSLVAARLPLNRMSE